MCCSYTLHCDFPQLNLHYLQESWHQDQLRSAAWPRTSFVAGPAVIYLIDMTLVDDPEPLIFYAKLEVFYLGSYLTLSYTQALQTSVDTKFVVHQSSEAFELVWNLSLPAFRVYLFIPVSSLASSGAVCYSCSVEKKTCELFEEIWALPKTHLVKVITTLRVVTEKNT